MTKLIYGSTKRWSNVASCAFRQWKAKSHCNQVHGYALTFEATFETTELDERNWVVDFGGLKTFKNWLEYMFDHKTLVALDDPNIQQFQEACHLKMLDLIEVDATGCEAIAKLAFESLESWLKANNYHPRVWLKKMQVWEHDGNSAYVRRADV